MAISALHAQARAYAEEGLPIFPCWPNSKIPASARGFYAATTDLATIDAWWTEHPDYNIGFSPDHMGWCVVDLDAKGPKDEVSGEQGWENLQLVFGDVPATYTVRTPRGGQHIYFEGRLPSTIRRIMPTAAIDTRGQGGYVLLPPSIVDGKPYEIERAGALAPLPGFIANAIETATRAAPATSEKPDLPANVSRARSRLQDLVRRGCVAVEGSGGNKETYTRCCELREMGISMATAYGLLREEYNPHCKPPWSDGDLLTLIEHAWRYGQNGLAAFAAGDAQEIFAASIPKPKLSKFHLSDESEMEVEKPIDWLVDGLIQSSTTVMLLGKTQSYKSFLAIDLALSIATGRDTFGGTVKQGPVVYAALEGRSGIMGPRRRAWRLAKEVEGRIDNFYVGRAPMIAVPEDLKLFGQEVEKRCGRPKLVIIDTLSKAAAGLNLNLALDANRFVQVCDSFVEAWGCTVMALHHIGKDEDRGAMGSAALHAGFDAVLEARAHRPTKTVEVWQHKLKDGAEAEVPWCFELQPIADSLVAQPIARDDFLRRTTGEDPTDPSKVGPALRQLGATEANPTTVHLLASMLIEAQPNEAPEDRQREIQRISRLLSKAATGKLIGFTKNGQWCLP